MDFNNNNENFNNSRSDFFNEIDSDNLKTSNISNNGISYGNEKNDNTKMILMVFFILFAIVLLIIMAMKLSNRNTKNNIAEIPVIEGYKDARVEHENDMPKQNELYDVTSYKKDKEENETHNVNNVPSAVKEVEHVKTVTPPKPEPKVVKTAVVKSVSETGKKKIQKPKVKILKQVAMKPKFIEKKTQVEGEVEIERVSQSTNMKKVATTATTAAWYVQLVSTLSEVSANNAWVKLSAQHPQLFTGVKHKVFKSVINGKTYYRLRAIGFDVNSATEFCNKLKSANLSCFVGK